MSASLADILEGLPVRLIATPRQAFQVCRRDEVLSDVVTRNQDKFDYFPVVELAGATGEKIVGLMHIYPFMHGENASEFVTDKMQPLSEENLIGADASLLTFIRNADRQRCRLVVSGPEINGLVCISDLQKLPVRAALFAMVTHLEMSMATAIRREFPSPEDWLAVLSQGRQAGVRKKVADAKSGDTFVDEILFTEFCDKVTILQKRPVFRDNKSIFESDLKKIQSLRNDLAHANDYAVTREAEIGVCETVRRIDHWIEHFAA